MNHWLRVANATTITYHLRDEHLAPLPDAGQRRFSVSCNRITQRLLVSQDAPPHQASVTADAWRELLDDVMTGDGT